jgi:hypothetical protein
VNYVCLLQGVQAGKRVFRQSLQAVTPQGEPPVGEERDKRSGLHPSAPDQHERMCESSSRCSRGGRSLWRGRRRGCGKRACLKTCYMFRVCTRMIPHTRTIRLYYEVCVQGGRHTSGGSGRARSRRRNCREERVQSCTIPQKTW